MMGETRPDDALDRYVHTLESFSADELDALLGLVTSDVRFRDPFNDVRGKSAFRRIFSDMAEQLDAIDFDVTERAWTRRRADGGVALIRWDLSARLVRLGQREWRVSGCSELHFTEDGRLMAHLDYWDAAGAFYERLPLLGAVLRRLRRRLAIDET
ncbi:MAG: nuclear transport factor 2 family protein [Gammaproteobacteria bacterium]